MILVPPPAYWVCACSIPLPKGVPPAWWEDPHGFVPNPADPAPPPEEGHPASFTPWKPESTAVLWAYVGGPHGQKAWIGPPAWMQPFQGIERFKEAQSWSQGLLQQGASPVPFGLQFATPLAESVFRFWTLACFEPEVPSSYPFPASCLVVPQWQLLLDNAQAYLVCTAAAPLSPSEIQDFWSIHLQPLWQEPSCLAEPIVTRPSPTPRAAPEVGLEPTPLSKGWQHLLDQAKKGFGKRVAHLAAELAPGHKCVLAQSCTQKGYTLQINPTLQRLQMRYPGCQTFCIRGGHQTYFLGTSPESLVQLRQGEAYTEALAGSFAYNAAAHPPEEPQAPAISPRTGASGAPVGTAPQSPQKRDTFNSTPQQAPVLDQKTEEEHRLVVTHLVDRLKALGFCPVFAPHPQVRLLGRLGHWFTPVTALASTQAHVLDLVHLLHPTPAVCGTPPAEAQARIEGLEGFTRGLYTGCLGYFNARGEGHFQVLLRCGLQSPQGLTLYAGCGILNRSKAVEEEAELALKYQMFLDWVVEAPKSEGSEG